MIESYTLAFIGLVCGAWSFVIWLDATMETWFFDEALGYAFIFLMGKALIIQRRYIARLKEGK